MRTAILTITALLLVPSLALALSAQLTASTDLEVEQRGAISISGAVSEVTVLTYIPQTDGAQKTEIIEVGDSSGICMLTDKTFSGMCSYQLVQDRLGNVQARITRPNPENRFEYYIRSSVSIERVHYFSEMLGSNFLKSTDMIQPGDRSIVRKASEITYGRETDFDKVAALTEWVFENVKYDAAYSGMKASASDTLKNRRGVCDEISVLLISMARALGYPSAYVAGYAMGKEDEFVAHGWSEVSVGDRTYPVDATWAEIPVDATHVKFALLDDSEFIDVSVSARGYEASETDIEPTNVSVKVAGSKEKPLLTGRQTLLADRLSQGYAVIRNDFAFDGCVLSELTAQSCAVDNKAFMERLDKEKTLWFCGKRSVFMIFGVPEMEASMMYSCPITISPHTGRDMTANISLALSYPEPPSIGISVDRTSVPAGGAVSVSSPGAHLFTSDGQYGFDSASFTVDSSMSVYSYRDGALAERAVLAVAEMPLEASITSGDSAVAGKSMDVSVDVTNTADRTMQVSVRLGNSSQTMEVAPGGSSTFLFSFTPESADDSTIVAYVSSGSFLTSSSKTITVTEEKGLLEMIMDFLMSLFRGSP